MRFRFAFSYELDPQPLVGGAVLKFSIIAWITCFSYYVASLVGTHCKRLYESIATNFDRLMYSSVMLFLWLLMALWFDPSIAFLFDMCYDRHICLLMGCICVFLLSLSIVRRHKVKALWPMASPMTLSSNTCYGLFLSFLQWNCRLSILIVVSFCIFRISSNLVKITLIFSCWVWTRLCLSLLTLLSALGSCWTFLGTSCWTVYSCTFNEWRFMLFLALFASCWVWWTGAQWFALFSYIPGTYITLLLSPVSCWNETWIYCVLQTKGLCVTSLFELVQPQSSIVFPLVYHDAFYGKVWMRPFLRTYFLFVGVWYWAFSPPFFATCMAWHPHEYRVLLESFYGEQTQGDYLVDHG